MEDSSLKKRPVPSVSNYVDHPMEFVDIRIKVEPDDEPAIENEPFYFKNEKTLANPIECIIPDKHLVNSTQVPTETERLVHIVKVKCEPDECLDLSLKSNPSETQQVSCDLEGNNSKHVNVGISNSNNTLQSDDEASCQSDEDREELLVECNVDDITLNVECKLEDDTEASYIRSENEPVAPVDELGECKERDAVDYREYMTSLGLLDHLKKVEERENLQFNTTSEKSFIESQIRSYCKLCEKYFPCEHSKKCSRARSKKVHICNVCNRVFMKLNNLKRHIQVHTGEKPFMCQLCKKSFSQNGSLKIHIRSHTGERPYVCRFCNRSFSEKKTLRCHVRTHTGEKPYICHTCNKSFAKRQNLKGHIVTHTGERPFVCQMCNKSFSKCQNLKRHIKSHTGEKHYTCHLCNKSFSENQTLKRHIRTHTGEKPFSCHVCSKSFSKQHNLKRHEKIHVVCNESDDKSSLET